MQMYASCKHINQYVAELFIYCLHIYLYTYDIWYTLFCSFLCLADHCMFFYFQPFPPHLQGKNPTKFIPGKPPRTGAKRVGWGCHHWPTWQHQLNPCLAHLQWYELSPGASMRHAGRLKTTGFFSCFLLDESDLPTLKFLKLSDILGTISPSKK